MSCAVLCFVLYMIPNLFFVFSTVEPADTRRRLCNDLKVLRTKKLENIPRKHTNLPL